MSMGEKLNVYCRMTFSPIKTCAGLAALPPRPLPAVGYMLLFRVPIAWAAAALSYAWAGRMIQFFRDPPPGAVDFASRFMADANSLFIEMRGLPSLPPLGSAWPWLGLFALMGILGLWMHNVAWDHAALWMLRGTKRDRPLGASCAAIAEAMGAASLGSLLGLAAAPAAGLLAMPLLAAANIYYWGLKGAAMAAFHGCPLWKGVAAALLHILLAAVFCGLLFSVAALLAVALVPPF